jgi:hypothetical protein
MGTLHQNRKGVPAEIECKTEKGRTCFSLQRRMIMKWKNKNINTIHDDKMVPTRVRGQDMENPKVVIA